jgi:hypothetical protein
LLAKPQKKAKIMFHITLMTHNSQSWNETDSYEWKVVPRTGEYVEVFGREYKVLRVVHNFQRGVDSTTGEITLYAEKVTNET